MNPTDNYAVKCTECEQIITTRSALPNAEQEAKGHAHHHSFSEQDHVRVVVLDNDSREVEAYHSLGHPAHFKGDDREQCEKCGQLYFYFNTHSCPKCGKISERHIDTGDTGNEDE